MANNLTHDPKVCQICGTAFIPTHNRQCYCTNCKAEALRRKAHRAYVKRYQHKGYNQAGASNNAWKGGIFAGYYKTFAFQHYGTKCVICGSDKHICVHHVDGDRYNNTVANLLVLCRRCHAKAHHLHRNLSRRRYSQRH